MGKKTALSISIIPNDVIVNKIFFIRGQKVMLDSDLAELYKVETKRLKEQVRRNILRFPAQYMFELTEKEFEVLRSQNATSNDSRGGTRYLPMVFTEHGVLQLSNILKSRRAIQVSFKIIDVFVKLRQVLADHAELRLILEGVKKKTENNTKNIEEIFNYLDKLLQKKRERPLMNPVGYKLPAKKKNK